MKEGVKYPDYIGVSEVTTRSFEHMRVESYFDGQPSLMFDEPAGFDITNGPGDKTVAIRPNAKGKAPSMAAKVVIQMGRTRNWQAW